MVTATKEKSILLRRHEIPGILDGRQTQLRRVVSVVKGHGKVRKFDRSTTQGYDWHFRCPLGLWQDYRNAKLVELCPFGRVGERRWGRELFLPCIPPGIDCRISDAEYVCYLDGDQKFKETESYHPWTLDSEPRWNSHRFSPATHMPRWASRITLEITAVRLERLQDISEEDAIANGAQCAGVPADLTNRGAFGKMWNKVNGAGAWGLNPWVWALNFRRVA